MFVCLVDCSIGCRKSYELAAQGDWLNEMQRNRDYANTNLEKDRVTFLVPSNAAWDALARSMPSVHKKLFMGQYSYHVSWIPSCHLFVSFWIYSFSFSGFYKWQSIATMSDRLRIGSIGY